MDPLAGTPWSAPGTVSGFSTASPNEVLMAFARAELDRIGGQGTAVDIGCGAARNAVPLAEMGWSVIGTDLSQPMLDAAIERVENSGVSARVQCMLAPMEGLPVGDASADLVIAHGIWNLATSSAQFRQSVREAPVWRSPAPRSLSLPSRATRCLIRRHRWPESPSSSHSSPDGRSVS
ncbi:MAG: class I SAM-dependent methyltransferase [Acidobacteria bacterium]|jgi:SAM-dependent methyltransferase|nr:class I SAM-dependent methyltransferase [Acidobacteriota bacterium]